MVPFLGAELLELFFLILIETPFRFDRPITLIVDLF